MSLFRRSGEVRLGNRTIKLAIATCLLSSCYIHRAPCPAYVDANYKEHGSYKYSDPLECSTWYEDPYSYMWVTDSKSQALMKWYEISARQMEFEIDGEFRYSVTASDGYKYHFWSMYSTPINTKDPYAPEGYQYIITVYKAPEDRRSIDL